ncbi:MAG: hypothetical protein SFY95_00380 [Planctomycetota bacterium]|nr:hypothetical protein [Planctomycetota bacterium]
MKSLLRCVAAVIVGYLATAVAVFVTFTGAYLLMGTNAAFREGSYDVSMLWIVTSIVLGFVAAVIGGALARVIDPRRSTGPALAGLILLLGVLSGSMALNRPDPGPRPPEVGNLEAMQRAKSPLWFTVLNPVVGIAGVLTGARLAPRRKRFDDPTPGVQSHPG